MEENKNDLNSQNNEQPIHTIPVQNKVIEQNYNQSYNGAGSQTGSDGKAIASIILGIICIILSIFLGIIVLPLGIGGLVLGILSKSKGKVAGIILNIIGSIISIVWTIILIILLLGMFDYITENKGNYNYGYDEKHYYFQDGYTLQYDSNWSEVTIESNNVEGLMYGDQELYLLSIGVKPLSEVEKNLNCDFRDKTCKDKIYESFYNYWNNDQGINQLFDGEKEFKDLKYGIVYITINYGESENDLKGKLYLIVSESDNSVICFISKADNYKEEDDDLIFDLLDSIFIDYQIRENTTDDEEDKTIEDNLNDLANWNRYKELRTGSISHNKSITGGWRILSDSEVYWVFKNNEFWWYKSVNNLNDNYWYGTTEILTGKEGFKKAGLNEDKVDKIIAQSNNKITTNDIYTIICTPKKIISDGVDKSSTNIPADLVWTYIWIIVDHGAEGIEAQVLDMSTSESSYYVKLND